MTTKNKISKFDPSEDFAGGYSEDSKLQISNCCNAPVKACWGDDFGKESKLKEPPAGATCWNACTVCGKPCDVKGVVEKPQNDWEKELQKAMDSKKFHSGIEMQKGITIQVFDISKLRKFISKQISKARKEAIYVNNKHNPPQSK